MNRPEEDYLAISGLYHYLVCKRSWALIHVEQQWDENYFTADGRELHKRADDVTIAEKRGDIIQLHALRVQSQELGMIGICDVVEFRKDEEGVFLPKYKGTFRPYPIEYKRGKRSMSLAEQMQLLAQIMSLEEMLNTKIEFGYMYYHATRKREKVHFSVEDRDVVRRAAEQMHELMVRGHTPKPKLIPACKGCSLNSLCLPILESKMDVGSFLQRRVNECESY